MTSVSQDFTVYAGDSALPVFTVVDGSGVAIDISGVSQILWNAQRDLDSAAVLSKTKTAGEITFYTDGTDGKFKVWILPTDSAPLSNYYIHQAIITDQFGNVSTVTTGRLRIARQPIWTYSGNPSLSERDAVRFHIQDTDSANPLYYDGEIDYLLTKFPNPLYAAAQAARSLAAKFAGQVTSKRVGDLALTYAEKVKNYLALADALEMQADQTGAQLYSGGTSKSDMTAVAADSNRVPQPFSRGQFDITPQSEAPAVPPDGLESL